MNLDKRCAAFAFFNPHFLSLLSPAAAQQIRFCIRTGKFPLNRNCTGSKILFTSSQIKRCSTPINMQFHTHALDLCTCRPASSAHLTSLCLLRCCLIYCNNHKSQPEQTASLRQDVSLKAGCFLQLELPCVRWSCVCGGCEALRERGGKKANLKSLFGAGV